MICSLFLTLLVTLNPQLSPDLTQQQVDPLALPGFALPQGQNGLFHVNTDPSHPYLIETNPAFVEKGTDLFLLMGLANK